MTPSRLGQLSPIFFGQPIDLDEDVAGQSTAARLQSAAWFPSGLKQALVGRNPHRVSVAGSQPYLRVHEQELIHGTLDRHPRADCDLKTRLGALAGIERNRDVTTRADVGPSHTNGRPGAVFFVTVTGRPCERRRQSGCWSCWERRTFGLGVLVDREAHQQDRQCRRRDNQGPDQSAGASAREAGGSSGCHRQTCLATRVR